MLASSNSREVAFTRKKKIASGARRKLELVPQHRTHSSPFPGRRRWNVNGSNPLDVLTQLRWILAPLPAILHFLFFPPARWPSRPIIDRLLTWDNVESFVAFPFSVEIRRGGGGRMVAPRLKRHVSTSCTRSWTYEARFKFWRIVISFDIILSNVTRKLQNSPFLFIQLSV